ncbi:MAG: hypothetical protein QNI99_15470 [Woeseiaceae bacterium]|nr:hypothetical protein [Woeseiaceae bacterium]
MRAIEYELRRRCVATCGGGDNVMDIDKTRELEEELLAVFVGLQTDSFNRALAALVEANAVDTTEMAREYRGIGSKYYDLVTESFEYTVKWAQPAIREILAKHLRT